MQSRFVEHEADAMVDRYGARGVPRDLALRVYTTRLLGGDPRLVLHGGGNTSVKLRLPDLMGREVDVLCVKGSGADMAAIEPAGLPAVRLAELRMLLERDAMSDEDMVRAQRANLLDPMAPNPSVETLLHAFIPHRFVDHTHATAVLSLIDQPDGEARAADLYDGRMGIVPYIMPGFGLAKEAARAFAAAPGAIGLILHKHGIFTFADTAREAYERMIEMVSLAEAALQRGRRAVFATAQLPQAAMPLAAVAPIVRGACSLRDERTEGAFRRLILEFRTGDAILNFVNGAEVARYATSGVVTPDHTIRTKNWPLVLAAPERGREADFTQGAKAAVAAFIAHYRHYFERNNARCGGTKTMLDPLPRVALVPGLGLFGLGRSRKEAAIAADLAEAAVSTITDAEAIGRFESISEADMFDCEYWSLEQAKLGGAKELPLAGQVAVVTGAAGAIGTATAKAFAAAGAEVALLDVDAAAAGAAATAVGGAAFAVACDVTDLGVRPCGFRQGGGTVRRRRYRGLQCGRGLDRAHRRSRGGGAPQELRAQFLRPSARRPGGGADHAGPGHRWLPVVQRVEAGGQSRAGFRALRTAQGGDLVPGAAIRPRLWCPRHPRQCGECRSGALRPPDRGHDRGALQRARPEREGLYERQSARTRGDGGRRGPGVPRPGARTQDDRRRHHGRWRQHRRGTQVIGTATCTRINPRRVLPLKS